MSSLLNPVVPKATSQPGWRDSVANGTGGTGRTHLHSALSPGNRHGQDPGPGCVGHTSHRKGPGPSHKSLSGGILAQGYQTGQLWNSH